MRLFSKVFPRLIGYLILVFLCISLTSPTEASNTASRDVSTPTRNSHIHHSLGSLTIAYIPINLDELREELLTLTEHSSKRLTFEVREDQVNDVNNLVGSLELSEGLKFNVRKQQRYDRYNRKTKISLYSISPDYLIAHGNHFHRASETEQHAGMILLILIILFMVSHALLKWWKHNYPSSHDAFTLLGLWLIPAMLSLYLHYYRFLVVWVIFSLATARILRRAIGKNVSGKVPRDVYTYFLISYKLAYSLAIVGYVVVMLDLFGITMLLGLAPIPTRPVTTVEHRDVPIPVKSSEMTGSSTSPEISNTPATSASTSTSGDKPHDNDHSHGEETEADLENVLDEMLEDDVESSSSSEGSSIASSAILTNSTSTSTSTSTPNDTATPVVSSSTENPTSVVPAPVVSKRRVIVRRVGNREVELSHRGPIAIQVVRTIEPVPTSNAALASGAKGSSPTSNSNDDAGKILAFGFVLMFYGIYFGLLGRDISAVAAERMAVTIGYYQGKRRFDSFQRKNDSEADPDGASLTGKHSSQRLDDNTCAICDDILHPHLSMEAREAGTANGIVEKVQKLSCGHEFHDFCLRGWLLVGKRDTCAYCNEKATYSENFSSPWEKQHVAWASFLDLVRFVLVFNPIIIVAMNIILLIFY